MNRSFIILFTNNNNVHYYVCAGAELDYNNGNPFICAQAIDIRPITTKQTYIIEATEEQYRKIQEIINN